MKEINRRIIERVIRETRALRKETYIPKQQDYLDYVAHELEQVLMMEDV